MSKNVVISIVVAIGLIGGAIWWFQSQSALEDGNGVQQGNEAGAGDAVSQETLSGRFADFITRGDNVQCTFSGTDPETGEYAEGSVYASGEKYYIEVATTIEGTPVTMQMIQTKEMMYIWSDNDEAVPAMSFDLTAFANTEMGGPADNSPTQWFDEPETDVDYSCRRWPPRAETFVPPADIQFMNPFAGMLEMMGGLEGTVSQ